MDCGLAFPLSPLVAEMKREPIRSQQRPNDFHSFEERFLRIDGYFALLRTHYGSRVFCSARMTSIRLDLPAHILCSSLQIVELPNGRAPAREFVDSLGDNAAARIDAFIERLRVYGNRMQGKFVKKLTDDIFELRVKQFDRIFRVLFFYQPGMLIVIASGFQKKTEQTPPAEIARAEQLRKLWMKYRNRYTGSQKERGAILKELGL
jgi:phage-related protein